MKSRGRRRSVFPLLDLELLRGLVSINSDCSLSGSHVSFVIFFIVVFLVTAKAVPFQELLLIRLSERELTIV